MLTKHPTSHALRHQHITCITHRCHLPRAFDIGIESPTPLTRVRSPICCVCVALQATISVVERSFVLESLHAALGKFRVELSLSTECLHDATLTAGLLLCSIGVRFYCTCHPNSPASETDHQCRRSFKAFHGQSTYKAWNEY